MGNFFKFSIFYYKNDTKLYYAIFCDNKNYKIGSIVELSNIADVDLKNILIECKFLKNNKEIGSKTIPIPLPEYGNQIRFSVYSDINIPLSTLIDRYCIAQSDLIMNYDSMNKYINYSINLDKLEYSNYHYFIDYSCKFKIKCKKSNTRSIYPRYGNS
jgi:hypothetical protein